MWPARITRLTPRQSQTRCALYSALALVGSGFIGAADIRGRDAGLDAECGDDALVQVLPADALGSVGEQQMHVLAGLAVQHGGLGWSDRLPRRDGMAEERIDRLGERGAGLVDRDVEQTDRVLGQYLTLGDGD